MRWRPDLTLVLLVSLMISASAAQVLRWKHSTRLFVRDNFQVELDPWQGRAADAFDDPAIPRISLQACVGPGKTAILAMMAWKFLTCHGDTGEHPRGAALAINWKNLKANFWPEMAKWQGRSPTLSHAFTCTAEQVFANDHPRTWYLHARGWAKTATPDAMGLTLSGLHSPYVAVFMDESGMIPASVLRACEQIFSTNTVFAKLVQAGNPNNLDGALYAAAAKHRQQWHIIRITGDPDDPEAWVHSPRVGDKPIAYARESIAVYGRDNPWVMSQILGQFPPASINALFDLEDVLAAQDTHLRIDQYNWAQKRLGVDTARYGGDLTVLFPRQGLAAFQPRAMRHLRGSAVSTDIAGAVMDAKQKWGSELELFDGTGGWSAGALDVLRASGGNPVDVQFHGKALDPRYKNRRAEMYFTMAKWLTSGAALPKVEALVQELTAQTYAYVNGTFQLEDKKLVEAKIGHSPNYSDALALTFGLPEMPRATLALRTRQQTALHDFDPYPTATKDWDPLERG